MVCIDEGPGGGSAGPLRPAHGRSAARAVDGFHVETTRSLRFSEEERDRIADTLRLAQQLGGGRRSSRAARCGWTRSCVMRASQQCLPYRHRQIEKVRIAELLQGSVTHELMRRAGVISVHVVAPRDPRLRHRTRRPRARITERRHSALCLEHRLRRAGSAFPAGMILDGSAERRARVLTAVLASAITYGLWPALYTSMISMLTFNFFFLPPLYTFTIADPENVVALFFFLVVAFIASNLTARVRSQASWRASAPRPPRTSICSAASSPASAPSTMCCGPPPSRSPRC